MVYLVPWYCIWGLFVGDVAIQMVPEHSAEVLSRDPEQETMILFGDKIHTLELLWGVSYDAVGCESNINRSIICIQ